MTRTRARSLLVLPLGRSVPLAGDERVLDALDEQWPGLGLPTACRAGNCGACLVAVVHGADALAPAAPRESATLRALAAAPDQRLGCQVRSVPHLPVDGPDIVLRVIHV